MLKTELSRQITKYFPYDNIRPYQDDFIKAVYETVEAKSHAVIEGANGLGKTIAVLSAVLPVAKKENCGILYCARTHKQMDRVIDELKAISKKAKVSGISIRGRREMCYHPLIVRHASDAKAAMEVCEQLKRRELCPYYQNMSKHTERCGELQLLFESKPFTASEILEICRSEKLCPYELTKLTLGQVDVVALSYIYLFDPIVCSSFFRYFNKPLSDFILILDEAHNLPDIAVEIASDNLTLFTIRKSQQEAKEYGYEDIANFCSGLGQIVERIAAPVADEVPVNPRLFIEILRDELRVDEPLTFFDYLYGTGNIIRRDLLMHGKYPRSFVHRIGEFLLTWLETSNDPAFTHIISKYEAKGGGPSARLEIIALDPKRITEQITSSVYSTISISGTLEPTDHYVKIIGLPSDTRCEAMPSPFPEEHILSLACVGVSTSLERRLPEMYRKLAKRIAEVTRYTPANIGVFTASYNVLEGLLEAGIEGIIEKPLFHEHRGMSSKENDTLIRRFKSYAKKSGAVLLGVQGGRSSEGADYPGDEMNAVVIVGVPYAQPTPRVNAQVQFYERGFPGHGYEYGYVLPAMKKASQAAGRPIRTLDDKGAIVFLDYRFSTAYCRKYLPLWIRRNLKTVPDEEGTLAKELILFFGFTKK